MTNGQPTPPSIDDVFYERPLPNEYSEKIFTIVNCNLCIFSCHQHNTNFIKVLINSLKIC